MAEAAQPPSSKRCRLALACVTLWRREMVRFFRQRNRVLSALCTPIILWLLLASGLNNAIKFGSEDGSVPAIGYREYFFPGALTMILLFTAIFSTITVIEDRKEGFLQGVLVAPVPRGAIVAGKVLGGTAIAMCHGILFLLLWPFITTVHEPTMALVSMLAAAAICLVMAIALTALGLCIAWPMDSVAGFHAVMMLFLMPMWFLSGAVFPMDGVSPWLKVLMWCNPVMYGQAALSAALRHGQTGTPMAAWHAVGATVIVTGLMMLLAIKVVGSRSHEPSP